MKALKISDRSVEEIEIENTLEALQKEVGGYIETVTLVRGYAVMIVGPALVVGVDGDEFADIPKDVERRIMARWG